MAVLEVAHQDSTFRCAFARNLVIATWWNAPVDEQMTAWRRLARERAARYPQGIALLDTVVKGTPAFSESVRKQASDFTREAQAYSLGMAHLILAPGLVGVTVRSFISTILLIARPRTPTKVFGTIDDAAPWLVTLLEGAGEAWTLEDMRAVCVASTQGARPEASTG